MSTAQYTSTYYEGYTEPLPVPGDGKEAAYNAYYNTTGSTYSVSPPEAADPSVVSSGVGYSATSGGGGGTYSYAGSTTGDYDSSAGSAAGVDFNEYMQDRFADSFDPIPLDRSVARQAQTSGQLNAKQQELLELQKKAQARLARTRARFAEGMADAREVQEDLAWTQKKVSSMKSKANRKHPKEYSKARERYPSPEY